MSVYLARCACPCGQAIALLTFEGEALTKADCDGAIEALLAVIDREMSSGALAPACPACGAECEGWVITEPGAIAGKTLADVMAMRQAAARARGPAGRVRGESQVELSYGCLPSLLRLPQLRRQPRLASVRAGRADQNGTRRRNRRANRRHERSHPPGRRAGEVPLLRRGLRRLGISDLRWAQGLDARRRAGAVRARGGGRHEESGTQLTDWDEAWSEAAKRPNEGDNTEDVIVFALAQIILAQVRESPTNRRQALAALAVAETILKLSMTTPIRV